MPLRSRATLGCYGGKIKIYCNEKTQKQIFVIFKNYQMIIYQPEDPFTTEFINNTSDAVGYFVVHQKVVVLVYLGGTSGFCVFHGANLTYTNRFIFSYLAND